MALSKIQRATLTRIRTGGNSAVDVFLDDEICSYLLGVAAVDLNLGSSFPGLPESLPPFFSKEPLSELRVAGINFLEGYEWLLEASTDADAYFACLAKLHKARLRYETILQKQPIPTLNQVGPRSLLQFGTLSPRALAGLLFWRKWMFDLDNRAGQETGYLFEPIIAAAIGGVPYPASKSPIKRKPKTEDVSLGGRQVDCIRSDDKRAYEFKLRVTIAASGQGRWAEELNFPADARYSGYTPVLIVLDSTENEKLSTLSNAFLRQNGEVYIGDCAWEHLETQAGPTMSGFIEKYVRAPMDSLLKEAPSNGQLPDFSATMKPGEIVIRVGDEELKIARAPEPELQDGPDEIPDDVDEV